MFKGRDVPEHDLLPKIADDFEWDGYSENASLQWKDLGEWSRTAQFFGHFCQAPGHNHDLNAHQRLNSTVATSRSSALT